MEDGQMVSELHMRDRMLTEKSERMRLSYSRRFEYISTDYLMSHQRDGYHHTACLLH